MLVVWAAFSPDGKLIVTISRDTARPSKGNERATSQYIARLWEVATGSERAVLKGVTSVVFSPDSKLVVTVSTDGTAQLWSIVP